MLNVRRAIIPAANGHCSARALARYYATLVDGGVVPLPHSSSSKPPLGSHSHIPKLSSQKAPSKQKCSRSKEKAAAVSKSKNKEKSNCGQNVESDSHSRNTSSDSTTRLVGDTNTSNRNDCSTTDNNSITNPPSNHVGKIFRNYKVHDAFLGAGEYGNLVPPDGNYGLGFRRYTTKEGSLIGFGHSGMGGSTGFCDVKNRFAIAVTVNKMSFGGVTAHIVNLVCSELNIPVPEEFTRFREMGPDTEFNLARPLIN